MIQSADEGRPVGGHNRKVEDHFLESGVGGMAMGFPVLRAGIEFDRTVIGASVNRDRAIQKVGPGTMIPLAKLPHLDLPTLTGHERASEVPCKEEGLQLDLARKGGEVFRKPTLLQGQEEVMVGGGHERASPRERNRGK